MIRIKVRSRRQIRVATWKQSMRWSFYLSCWTNTSDANSIELSAPSQRNYILGMQWWIWVLVKAVSKRLSLFTGTVLQVETQLMFALALTLCFIPLYSTAVASSLTFCSRLPVTSRPVPSTDFNLNSSFSILDIHTTTTPTMPAEPHSLLEVLPPELALQILLQIPTTSALSALVRASPTYHQIYLTKREEIFTAATLNELASRGVSFPAQRSDMGCMQWRRTRTGWPMLLEMEDALAGVCGQVALGHSLRISMRRCLMLLNILRHEPDERWDWGDDSGGVFFGGGLVLDFE